MTDGKRISTTLLSACADAGLYRLPEGADTTLQKTSKTLGFSFSRIDLTACSDKRALLEHIATALAFPEWFGHNWDALADCLADLSWIQGQGHVILLENIQDAHQAAQEQLETVLQIFEEATQRQRDNGTALWVFVDIRSPGLPWLRTP